MVFFSKSILVIMDNEISRDPCPNGITDDMIDEIAGIFKQDNDEITIDNLFDNDNVQKAFSITDITDYYARTATDIYKEPYYYEIPSDMGDFTQDYMHMMGNANDTSIVFKDYITNREYTESMLKITADMGMHTTYFKRMIGKRDCNAPYTAFVGMVDMTLALLPQERHDDYINTLAEVAAFLRHYCIKMDTRVYMNVLKMFASGMTTSMIVYVIVDGHSLLGYHDGTIVRYSSKFNNTAKADRLIAQKHAFDAASKQAYTMNAPSCNYMLKKDMMIVIGKYFDTPRDYVNVTRTCSEYKDLISMYKYNPIAQSDIFINKQTLWIYSKADLERYMNSSDRYYEVVVKYPIDITSVDAFTAAMDMTRPTTRYRISGDVYGNGIYSYGSVTFDHRITMLYPKRLADTFSNVVEATLPTGIREIPDEFFRDSFLVEVSIPSTVRKIGRKAFYGCCLKHVLIPDGVECIGDSCFDKCIDLETVILPSTLRYIGRKAFKNTILSNVTIPDSVEYMGYGVFLNCIRNMTINIPKNVRSFQKGFIGDIALEKLLIPYYMDDFDLTLLGDVYIYELLLRKTMIVMDGNNIITIKPTQIDVTCVKVDNISFYEYDPTPMFPDRQIFVIDAPDSSNEDAIVNAKEDNDVLDQEIYNEMYGDICYM